MDGIWVFLGAGAGIGGLVGLALCAPFVLPRLSGGKDTRQAEPERLEATITAYAQLEPAERERLQKQTSHFLKTKKLHSENGPLPPILATAVAGNACLLRLHRDADCYPDLREIRIGDGPAAVSAQRVDLNWSEVHNALGSERNPVVRAFAQILRDAPTGGDSNRSAAPYPEKWQRLFKTESGEINPEESPVFAKYGQDARDDFFLSACEAYFQQGAQLLRRHPKLYALLHEYFGVHSASRG